MMRQLKTLEKFFNHKKNQQEFIKASILELQNKFKNSHFKLLWEKNISFKTDGLTEEKNKGLTEAERFSFKEENYPNSWGIDFVFEVQIKEIIYKFYCAVKPSKTKKYEFARNKMTINQGLNHSLRIWSLEKKYPDYDEKIVKSMVEFLGKIRRKEPHSYGYIKTRKHVANNPENKTSAVFYRDNKIILGDADNLITYLMPVING